MTDENRAVQKATVRADPKTRFPLLSIPGVPFETMWLPFTRIQLELFLSEINDIRYDAAWYAQKISKNNPRTSPNRLDAFNLNGAFATNVLLHEARRIADWFGQQKGYVFDLPTTENWTQLCSVTASTPAFSVNEIPAETDPRARIIVQRLNDIGSPTNLAEQMMLGAEISEYVYQGDARQFCQIANGCNNDFIQLRPEHTQLGDRQPNLSFRLIRRKM